MQYSKEQDLEKRFKTRPVEHFDQELRRRLFTRDFYSVGLKNSIIF